MNLTEYGLIAVGCLLLFCTVVAVGAALMRPLDRRRRGGRR